MVFWREHDELYNRFTEEFKNAKSFPSGTFYFHFVLPDSLFLTSLNVYKYGN